MPDLEQGSIHHPEHKVPDDVARLFSQLDAAEIAAKRHLSEIISARRPNIEERLEMSRLTEQMAAESGVNRETLQRFGEIKKGLFDRTRPKRLLESNPFEIDWPTIHNIFDQQGPAPKLTDHSFWWATTDWWGEGGITASFGDDGLSFTGSVNSHDGSLQNYHFGYVSYFEVQPERIPAAGQLLSAPRVNMSGKFLATTGDEHLFSGDMWSKCWMHLDHKIYQPVFGGLRDLGHHHEVQQLVNLDGDQLSEEVWLPGTRALGPIFFSGDVAPAVSVWARVEVAFHVQLEGAGSDLWLAWQGGSARALFNTPQWPLLAV